MIRTEYYIGMDVHKDTVQMAVFAETGEEPIYERKMSNITALLVKEVGKFSEKGKTEAAYEAGCLGYVIQRALEGAGVLCYVLPANKVAKKRTDRIKTDKRDARLIGRELRSKTIKPIAVPDEIDEAARVNAYGACHHTRLLNNNSHGLTRILRINTDFYFINSV